MAPLGPRKTILPPSLPGRISDGERRIDKLERRSGGRWVYPGGVPDSDPAAINANTWADDLAPDLIFGWINGWTDSGTDDPASDGLTRYRIGPSGFEMALNATGGSLGTIMFTLLRDFWDHRDGKQTFSGADDIGSFTCYTIVPQSGNIRFADVYAGRV